MPWHWLAAEHVDWSQTQACSRQPGSPGACPDNDWWTRHATLNSMGCRTVRHCSWCNTDLIWSHVCVKTKNKAISPQYRQYTYSMILTTPFWTLKPSEYLTCGRLMTTSTTGGHDTTNNFTTVWLRAVCQHTRVHIPRCYIKSVSKSVKNKWTSKAPHTELSQSAALSLPE